MKYSILGTLLCILFSLFSCGQENSNYQEPCSNNDFEKAHKIINDMKSKAEDFRNNNELRESNAFGGTDYSNQEKYANMVRSYLEGVDYVYNAEIRFLLQENSDESSKRIIFLLHEMDGEIAKYKENAVYTDIEEQAKSISTRTRKNILALAQEVDNEYLVNKLNPESSDTSTEIEQ